MHRTPIISQPWDNLEQSLRFGIVFLEMMSCDQGAVHKERRSPEMLCSFDRHISLVWVYLGYNEVSVGFLCKKLKKLRGIIFFMQQAVDK